MLRPVSATLMTFFFFSLLLFEHAYSRDTLFFYHTEFEFESPTTDAPLPDSETESDRCCLHFVSIDISN